MCNKLNLYFISAGSARKFKDIFKWYGRWCVDIRVATVFYVCCWGFKIPHTLIASFHFIWIVWLHICIHFIGHLHAWSHPPRIMDIHRSPDNSTMEDYFLVSISYRLKIQFYSILLRWQMSFQQCKREKSYFHSSTMSHVKFVEVNSGIIVLNLVSNIICIVKEGQLVEWLRHWPLNHEIVGSSPSVRSVFCT